MGHFFIDMLRKLFISIFCLDDGLSEANGGLDFPPASRFRLWHLRLSAQWSGCRALLKVFQPATAGWFEKFPKSHPFGDAKKETGNDKYLFWVVKNGHKHLT